MQKGWLVAVLVTVSLAFAGCSGGAGGGAEEQAGGSGDVELESGAAERSAASSEAGGAGDEAVAVAEPLPPLGPRVIQTASLTLSVPRRGFQGAVDRARTLATSFGGFVVGSTAAQGHERRLVEGTLVLRVPERSYARAIRELSRLGRVEAREESGQDVSREFVDLEARGRHLEAVERQLLGLLGDAETVAEALAVQSELNQVQLDLEQVRGRLQYLRDQVAFATISLSIHERRVEPDDDGETAWGIVDAWRTAAQAFVTVVGWMLIAAATAAPIVLLLALALLAARFAARRGRLAWRRS